MTSDSSLKKKIRAYAAEHNVPYSEARNRVVDAAGLIGDVLASGATTERVLTIQRATREDLSMPMPFRVFADTGYVDQQDFWNGDPWLLIGFEDRDPDAMKAVEASTGSPGGRNIAVTREQFADDPQRAVGLYPVFADRQRTWAAWTDVVASVRDEHVSTKQSRTVTAHVTTSTGDFGTTLDVGPFLRHMPRDDIRAMRREHWESCPSSVELAFVASRSGEHPALDRMFEHLDTLDLDYDDPGYEVRLDPAQAEAWCAANGYSDI